MKLKVTYARRTSIEERIFFEPLKVNGGKLTLDEIEGDKQVNNLADSTKKDYNDLFGENQIPVQDYPGEVVDGVQHEPILNDDKEEFDYTPSIAHTISDRTIDKQSHWVDIGWIDCSIKIFNKLEEEILDKSKEFTSMSDDDIYNWLFDWAQKRGLAVGKYEEPKEVKHEWW